MHLVCVAQLLLVPHPPSTLSVIGMPAACPQPSKMRDDVSGLASACPGAPFVKGASFHQPRRVASKEPPKWLAYRLLASTLAVRACRVGLGQCGCRRLRVDGWNGIARERLGDAKSFHTTAQDGLDMCTRCTLIAHRQKHQPV